MKLNIGYVFGELHYLQLFVLVVIFHQGKTAESLPQIKINAGGELPDNFENTSSSTNDGKTLQPQPHIQLPSNLDSQLLPDSLPAAGARPVFLTEPEDSYVIKSRPAELSCKVVHATGVHILCNDDIQKQARTEEYTQRGINITEAKVKINRDQVEEFFGDYHCACVAWSANGSAKSRLALVTIAFLKKEFETPPYSDQTRVGQQLEGKPKPDVYWLKDGVRLSESDDNYIVTSEGHLILVTARPQDAGNYTCVAENLAAKRQTNPAEISIFAGGGWSAWSSWSACSVSCGQGIQQRGRICSQDKPCNGNNIEKRPCEALCPGIDGGWSTWSAWSSCSRECTQISCSSQCTQTRDGRRVCDSPAPSNGGHYCFGVDYDSRKCGDQCIEPAPLADGPPVKPPPSRDNGVWVEPALTNETEDAYSIGSNEIALYIGLSLAVLVFLVVVLVAISLVRRRRLPHGYALTQTGFDVSHEKKIHGYNGDLTPGSTEIASVCYEYSYSDSNSNHSKNGYLSAREHHYEQPMVLLPASRSGDTVLGVTGNGRSPVDSMAKPLISDTSSSSAGGNISPRSAGTFERSPSGGGMGGIILPNNNNLPPTSLTPPPRLPYPGGVVGDLRGAVGTSGFTRWCAVTSQGGRLSLSESGITLTVPEGALPVGHTQDLYLSVIHDTKCYPNIAAAGQTTLLSPIVVVGPTSAARLLQKPVILSFPHVASLRHGGWTISVIRSADTTFTDESCWRHLVTLGQENINTTVYTQLDLNTCHIMTDTLGGYCLTGASAPPPSLPAFKSLRIAAFAQEYAQGADLTVRLYCVPDTDDAIKFVQETEKQFGGRLLDKPVSALLQAGGQNLRLSLDRLCEGWAVQPGASVQEVPFSHLWTVTSNPNLHCSFSLRSTSNSCVKQYNRSLALQISVHQQGNSDKCVLKVNTTISTCKATNNNNGRNSMGMGTSSSQCSSNDSYGSGGSAGQLAVFRLPGHTKEGLARLLDAPVPDGNDWRLLAERLNVHRYPAFFGSRPSPTEAILNLWEAKNRESSATQGLLSILRGMRRMDCVRLLEQQLQLQQ